MCLRQYHKGPGAIKLTKVNVTKHRGGEVNDFLLHFAGYADCIWKTITTILRAKAVGLAGVGGGTKIPI